MDEIGRHKPVLLKEAIEFLNVKKGGKYIDATLGAGGHGEAILGRGGVLLGIDQDPDAIEAARGKLKVKSDKHSLTLRDKLKIVHGNFRDIEKIARENNFLDVDGVLFDLGMSSMQIEKSGRGFSFTRDEILDMRMDPENQGVTAADLINSLPKIKLYELFNSVITKNLARRLAGAIISARPLNTTAELVNLANMIMPKTGKTHPATTMFMALRMAVNSEIENLELGLQGSLETLASGGRLAVISFHSGEDRIVKEYLVTKQKAGSLKILNREIITPTDEEIYHNPRSRSAKLRVAEIL